MCDIFPSKHVLVMQGKCVILSWWSVCCFRDPNTIFRGNTLASKCIDELMKLVGLHYLHDTLKDILDVVCILGWMRIRRRDLRLLLWEGFLMPEMWYASSTYPKKISIILLILYVLCRRGGGQQSLQKWYIWIV